MSLLKQLLFVAYEISQQLVAHVLLLPREGSIDDFIKPLECRGNNSATSNDMKLVHWSLKGGLLHLVQRGGAWVGL